MKKIGESDFSFFCLDLKLSLTQGRHNTECKIYHILYYVFYFYGYYK